MNFEELKAEILNRAKRKEVCEEFQTVQNATTYSEILALSEKLFEWCWISKIIDLQLLQEFPLVNLQDANIYTGNVTISNPKTKVIIVPGADVSIELFGNSRSEILCLGGFLSINSFENSFVKIKATFDSALQINSFDNSIVQVSLIDNSVLNIKSNSNSNCHILAKNESIVTAELNETSFNYIKAHDKATVNYIINDSAEIKIRQSDNSTITDNGIPL